MMSRLGGGWFQGHGLEGLHEGRCHRSIQIFPLGEGELFDRE